MQHSGIQLNKVDRMIRDMLLGYPTLYANRFDAFATLMTNSCYEWNDQGELVYIMPEGHPVSTESMVEQYRTKLLQARQEYDPDAGPDCLVKLHVSYITNDERKLHDAEFIAKNIDVYAATWCGVDSKQMWLWLFYQHRHGISPYWVINNKPTVVDEEWRLAIKDWLSQILPSANSMMGRFVEVNGGPTGRWQAIPGYEEVFNWVGETLERYTTEADREASEQQRRIADDILARLQAEEAAADEFLARQKPQ